MSSAHLARIPGIFLYALVWAILSFPFQASVLYSEDLPVAPSYVDPVPAPVEWFWLGPLPASVSFDLSLLASPAGHLNLSRPVATPIGPLQWKPVTGWVNNAFFLTDGPRLSTAAFTLWFYAEVTASQPATALWTYDGDDMVRIWIHGHESDHKPYKTGIWPWLFATPLTLGPERLPLLARVDNDEANVSFFSALHYLTDFPGEKAVRSHLFKDLERPENLETLLLISEVIPAEDFAAETLGQLEFWQKALPSCPLEKIRQAFQNIRRFSSRVTQREYAKYLKTVIGRSGAASEFFHAQQSHVRRLCRQKKITLSKVRQLFFQGQTREAILGTRLLNASGLRNPELIPLLLRELCRLFGQTFAWEDYMECTHWSRLVEKRRPGLGHLQVGIAHFLGGDMTKAIQCFRQSAEKQGHTFETVLWLYLALQNNPTTPSPTLLDSYHKWKTRADDEDRQLFQRIIR